MPESQAEVQGATSHDAALDESVYSDVYISRFVLALVEVPSQQSLLRKHFNESTMPNQRRNSVRREAFWFHLAISKPEPFEAQFHARFIKDQEDLAEESADAPSEEALFDEALTDDEERVADEVRLDVPSGCYEFQVEPKSDEIVKNAYFHSDTRCNIYLSMYVCIYIHFITVIHSCSFASM